MKNFLRYLKSPKSDFLLFIIALVLLNLVSARSFFRLDATAPKSYSLSQASKQVVKTLEQPLSVKVFFSSNLPSPYNGTATYVTDLLTEYSGAGNKYFSWERFDMDQSENQSLASAYRLSQAQIQEVKDNEVGFKSVWMGIVLTYADRIETIDGVTSSEGLEYKLTSKMVQMINAVNTLSGLKGQVSLTLYISPRLADFNIKGFSSIKSSVQNAFSSLNEKNEGRITYSEKEPAQSEIQALSEKYGLQTVGWTEKDGSEGKGVIGLVLEYGEAFRLVPLQMSNTLFGGYVITGLDDMEQSLSESLTALTARSADIGYVTGHGERGLYDAQNGAANFVAYSSDWYTFKELNLNEKDISPNISTLVINGPVEKFSDAELYKIDQFLLRGGNIALFLDPYIEKQDQTAMYYGMPPTYEKNETGLEKLLSAYGFELGEGYVMDTQCYVSNTANGKTNFYYAPLLYQSGMNKKHPISANLSYVLFLQSGAVKLLDGFENPERSVTVLAKTSKEAWVQKDISVLNPSYIFPPAKTDMKEENLALIAEGSFKSAFDKPVETDTAMSDAGAPTGGTTAQKVHLTHSLQKGRFFFAGSSKITTGMLINDDNGSQAIAMFDRNAIDYLNGNEQLCAMRTKGLSLNALNKTTAAKAALAKIINQYGLPLFTVIAGFLVWHAKSRRKRKIRNHYLNAHTEDR